MNAKKLVVFLFLLIIVCVGAVELHSMVSRSQAAYHPPDDATGITRNHKWHPASAEEKAAASKAVIGQLDAFKQNDYAKAATYQSIALRNNFPTMDSFRSVIQRSYPQFAHYKSIVFTDAVSVPAQSMVGLKVKLTGQDGVTVAAVYYMHKEHGSYKVAGVVGGGVRAIPKRSVRKA